MLPRPCFTAFATALAFTAVSYGQLTRGFVSGVVQDPTGAVIGAATVRLTNKGTNLQRESTTNDLGFYRFVAVEPGMYSVEFSKAGFESRRVDNIEVSTSQEVVLNQALTVGATATAVEIQEAPPGVELAKSTATMDRTLGTELVEKIPVFSTTGQDRDVTRLALLAPAVNRTFGQNGFSVNGQRSRNNNFTIDGVDNNDVNVTIANNRVIPESVAEFQIQTSSYSAEFGRNTGGQVSVITKSGTNEFHGLAFDYYKGNWMEPVSLLNKRAGLTETPRFVQNDAGGAIGGPIIRNRTFFFGLIETNRFRQAADSRNGIAVTIPTAAGYAALRNLPLGPDQTTQSRQSILDAISFFPEIYEQGVPFQNLRSVAINGAPVEVGSTTIPLSNPFDFWTYQLRVDEKLTDRDQLMYRLHLDKRNQPDVTGNLNFGSRFSADQQIYGQNHALSHTRTFSPTLINEFRFSFARRNLDFPEKTSTPTIDLPGLFTIGGSNAFPQSRITNTFQFQNIATWLVGRHSLKMGADLRRTRAFSFSAFDYKGTFTYNSLPDFINNSAFRLRQAVNTASWDARQLNQFYFFQDDIKVSRNFTLNLGLRYEYSDIPLGFFGAATPEIAAAGVPLPAKPDKNNWAPRAGFAYSPSSKEGLLGKLFGDGLTVFRGGYGIGYDILFYNILTSAANNYPRVSQSEYFQPQTVNLYPTLLPRVAPSLVFNPLLQFLNTPADIQNPTAHFYSLAIQRQFGSKLIAEIGYTGSRSYHQVRQGQTNPGILTAQQAAQVRAARDATVIPGIAARRLNPNWGSRVTFEGTGLARYDAMFLRFDKRFSRGLTLGANYTWSATFSDNDEPLTSATLFNAAPHVPQDYFNYKPEWSRSLFDRPNRFVVHYSYDVPWFGNPSLNSAVMRHVFRGWTIAGFTELQSGDPFSIRTGVDSGGTGEARGHRPDYNPNGILIKDPVDGNLRTFTIPLDGSGIVVTPLDRSGVPLANVGFGNLARNAFRGPSLQLWHFSVSKNIDITERIKVVLRNDITNLFNHRNWGAPVTQMNSPAFGQNILFDPGNRTMFLVAHVRF